MKTLVILTNKPYIFFTAMILAYLLIYLNKLCTKIHAQKKLYDTYSRVSVKDCQQELKQLHKETECKLKRAKTQFEANEIRENAGKTALQIIENLQEK